MLLKSSQINTTIDILQKAKLLNMCDFEENIPLEEKLLILTHR